MSSFAIPGLRSADDGPATTAGALPWRDARFQAAQDHHQPALEDRGRQCDPRGHGVAVAAAPRAVIVRRSAW